MRKKCIFIRDFVFAGRQVSKAKDKSCKICWDLSNRVEFIYLFDAATGQILQNMQDFSATTENCYILSGESFDSESFQNYPA